jgi:hypothetical protein
VKARALAAVLLFVPLVARATCEEGAAPPAAASACHGHASDSAPAAPASSDATDCCPACDAFVSAQPSDPAPHPTSLPLPVAALLLAPDECRAASVDRPPDRSSRPLSRENLPLLS